MTPFDEALDGFGAAMRWPATHARLLQLDSALGAALVPIRCRVTEAVCDGLLARVDVLAAPGADLDSLLGGTATLRLLQADGGYRGWHGHVVETRLRHAARPRLGCLTLRSWTALLDLRHGCAVHCDATAVEILERTFARWPQTNWRWDADVGATPPRSRRVQYRETDWSFCTRLLADEGFAWHVEQVQDDDGDASHVLVVTDDTASRRELGCVRFAAEHPTAVLPGQLDAVSRFSEHHAVRAVQASVGAWNPECLAGEAARTAIAVPGPALEHYDGRGVGRFADAQAARAAAARRLQAFDRDRRVAAGQGSARHFVAGAVFELVGAPRGDGRWLLTRIEHEAANNLGADWARLLQSGDVERGRYRNRFEALPADRVPVPPPPRAPTARGPQLATVVGVEHGVPATDRALRVRLRHAWEPGTAADAPAAATRPWPARAGQAGGAWIRVVQPTAGADWGSVFVPRVGSEVLVAFDDGDLDRPIVVGSLFNGRDRPPYGAGEGTRADQPAALSGVISSPLAAAGVAAGVGGEWLVDDTTGALRMRLSCVPTPAELGIGQLVAQRPGDAGRGEGRGSGFEATTAGWASLRAAAGLLLTTHRRPARGGSAAGAQMDADEAGELLATSRDTLARLADAAARSGAPCPARAAPAAPDGPVAGAARAIGRQRPDGDGGAPAGSPIDGTLRFEQPMLALAARSTLVVASDAGVVHAAGGDGVDIVGGDASEFASDVAAWVASGATRVCALGPRLTAVAGAGDASLAAHGGALQILADQDVRVSADGGDIRIVARRRIELVGGTSALVVDGRDIRLTTPGRLTVCSPRHRFAGPERAEARLPALPDGRLDTLGNWIAIQHRDGEGNPFAGQHYVISFEGGVTIEGRLDSQGAARHEAVPEKVIRVEYTPREPSAQPPWPPLEHLVAAIRSRLASD